MSKIKVRIYDTKQRKYISPSHIYLKTDGTLNTERVGNKLIEEQYSGVKGTDGTEIYEGDIVSSEEYLYMLGVEQNYVGIIEKHGCSFYVKLKCVNKSRAGISDGIYNLLEEEFERLKCIGNINENPELLLLK